jgi:hypothetical protein
LIGRHGWMNPMGLRAIRLRNIAGLILEGEKGVESRFYNSPGAPGVASGPDLTLNFLGGHCD